METNNTGGNVGHEGSQKPSDADFLQSPGTYADVNKTPQSSVNVKTDVGKGTQPK